MATIEDALLAMANLDAWNRLDAAYGTGLAERVVFGRGLTPSLRQDAMRLLAKYRRLLARQGIDYDALTRFIHGDRGVIATRAGVCPACSERYTEGARVTFAMVNGRRVPSHVDCEPAADDPSDDTAAHLVALTGVPLTVWKGSGDDGRDEVDSR